MPNIKSAIKRVSVNSNKARFNKAKKSELKTVIKRTEVALNDAADNSAELLKKAQASIDRAVSKGLIHRNKAARKKSQLAKKLRG